MAFAEGRTAVVAGAGLAGLASAIALRQAGWDVHALERRASPDAGGAGIVLHPNALQALARLGVLDAVLAGASELETLRAVTASGTGVDVDLRDVWAGSPYRTVATARPALGAALRRRAEDLGVSLRAGATVTSVVARDGHTEVGVEGEAALRCDLVVACDGVRSGLRGLLAPTIAAAPLDMWWARWVTPCALLPPGAWRTWTRGHATCGAYAIGPAGTHVFLQLPAELAEPGVAAVAREMAERFALLREALDTGAQLIHAGRAHVVRKHCWTADAAAVAFAGDAAHALSPTMSEGGGLALEDGVALGEEARVATGTPELLARYRERRRRRVAWAARMGELQLRRLARATPRPPAAALSPSSAAAYLRAVYRPLMEAA
ncbi:MAG TPA: FAD-dependent monooxygenase [Baekduia sp.]|jgi:2-polyprenyl-6-methoxyphenol hydroxylase-like FAD-dependent oxidoreductase